MHYKKGRDMRAFTMKTLEIQVGTDEHPKPLRPHCRKVLDTKAMLK